MEDGGCLLKICVINIINSYTFLKGKSGETGHPGGLGAKGNKGLKGRRGFFGRSGQEVVIDDAAKYFY